MGIENYEKGVAVTMDKEWTSRFQQVAAQDAKAERLEETIHLCIGIMREQKAFPEEPRIKFFAFLSDIFRFEWLPIFGLQTIVLFCVCFTSCIISDALSNIPAFMPLFVLAVMPVIFKGQYYRVSEIEAATRSSGAQIMLAKLILAGAANLVCITVFLCVEIYLHNSCKELGQMILYCLVPYLMSMILVLRLIRLGVKDSIPICAILMLGSCLVWFILSIKLPWLYQTTATGVWIVAFTLFSAFFIREIYFIVRIRREGKMYGIIA